MRATRDAYGETLAKLRDRKIVVLDADLSESTRTRKFAKKHPDRFFDFGIAEANMMSHAAGLAATGKTVFASTFTCFASARDLDQIRVSICYSDVNVKICATHGGLTVGEDGASHQGLSDIAIMRSMPNMKVIVPADPHETEQVIRWAAKDKGPTYVRLGRPKVADLHKKFGKGYEAKFRYGRAQKMTDGRHATIIACGYMVEKALDAALRLKEDKINVTVLNMSTLKPLDEKAILRCPKPIVTVEEGLLNSGFGNAVAAVLCEKLGKKDTSMIRLGVDNRFGQSGDAEGLLKEYHLQPENIVRAVKRLV